MNRLSRSYSHSTGTVPESLLTSTVSLANDLDFLWLEITQKCNLKCSHCYVSSAPTIPLYGKMTDDDWIEVIRSAGQLGCRRVQFIGGEPTVHPRLGKFILEASRIGYTFIEVFTNGTSITPRRAEFFAANNVNIACSFYSDNPGVHDDITGRKGSFRLTLEGIRELMLNGISPRIGFIEMAKNKGQYNKVKNFLLNEGLRNVGFDREREFGRAAQYLEDKIGSDFAFGDLCSNCWRGRLCVSYSGEAYPCIMSRNVPVGNVLEGGLQSVVIGDALRDFRERYSAACVTRQIASTNAYSKLEVENLRHLMPCPPGPDCKPTVGCKPDNCAPDLCRPDVGPCLPDVCMPDRCGPEVS